MKEFTELDMQRAYMEGIARSQANVYTGRKLTRNWLELADEWIDTYRNFIAKSEVKREPNIHYCKKCSVILLLSVEKKHKICFDCKYNECTI